MRGKSYPCAVLNILKHAVQWVMPCSMLSLVQNFPAYLGNTSDDFQQ